jgi:hypothetical protein
MEPIVLSGELRNRIIEKIHREPRPQSQWHPDLELSGKVINELLTLPTWEKMPNPEFRKNGKYAWRNGSGHNSGYFSGKAFFTRYVRN